MCRTGLRINNDSTVFMAELTAINEAICYAADHDDDKLAFTISDSMSAFQSITYPTEDKMYNLKIRKKVNVIGNLKSIGAEDTSVTLIKRKPMCCVS